MTSVQLTTGGAVEVEAEVCEACGARFYDLVAMEQLTEARRKDRARRRRDR